MYIEMNNKRDFRGGGSSGIMVIVVGNRHGDTSSNPLEAWLYFILH